MKGPCLGLALLCNVLFPGVPFAQWASSGTPLTTVPGNQEVSAAAPDGTGGTLITWEDGRSGTLDIYVQRVGANGVAQWTADGVLVCGAAGIQEDAAIVSDGAGGAIVAWADFRGGNYDVYAQRVNAAGVVQWTANGVVISTAVSSQNSPLIVSDGAGGAIVVWQDTRAGNADVYAQRINAAGIVQWTGNGVTLVDEGNSQGLFGVIGDGAGGAIAVWQDFRFGIGDVDIFAQRVNAGGARQWGLWGTSVCGSLGVQDMPSITSDGSGGAIVAWQDHRGADRDIYAQRLNAAGTAQWTFNGVVLCSWVVNQELTIVTADGAGGAIVAWSDERGVLTTEDLYAQRVSSTGAPLWTKDGVAVCNASGLQSGARIAADGKGGAIIAWNDFRFAGPDAFGQHLDALGAAQWTPNGMDLGPAVAGVNAIVPDGTGGTVIAWSDNRSGEFEVYAQRLDNVYGYWGHPEPIVESVADIPNDQGGKVAVNWTGSGRDLPNPRTIEFYSVWRAVDAIPFGAESLASDDLRDVRADDTGPIYLSTPGHYFERIGTQTAHGWPGYSFAASTRADSIAASSGDEVFMVAAHYLYDTYIAFASNEVIGHSVDNLAPLAPLLLTAQRIGADVQLNWNRAVAPDLRDYSIYRASSSGVIPVPINFLASAEDTLAVDANAPTSALYYIVTAKDVHDNQSDPSNEASVGALTAVGNTPALTTLAVLQNHPNPFNATTDFEIGMPSNADVTIDVFDVAGRRVSTMEINGAKAGWNRISFAARDERGRPLASGVYFCRVRAAGATVTRKMVIAR